MAQIKVPTPIPTKPPKKQRDKTTAKAQLQKSYIVFVFPMLVLYFWENSLTTNSYASGGKYVWKRRETPKEHIIAPKTKNTIWKTIPSNGINEIRLIKRLRIFPYIKAVTKDRKNKNLIFRKTIDSKTKRKPWKTYSATPKEKNGKYGEIFKCKRYAGATIIDIPKLAFSNKAVPNANTIIPITYANSL